MDNLKIRKGQDSDLEDIYNIEKNQIDSWSFPILMQDLMENDFSTYLVAELDNELVGFISLMNIAGEIHINNIAVEETFRGRKIGGKLLLYGLNYFTKKDLIGYTLEVREDNIPAINLYKKHGFVEMGLRKNYYNNNKSAIIMWKYLEEIE